MSLDLCDDDPDLQIEVVPPDRQIQPIRLDSLLGRAVTAKMHPWILAKLRQQCAGPDFGGDEVRS